MACTPCEANKKLAERRRLEHARKSRPGVKVAEDLADYPVFIVIRHAPDGDEIILATPDEYVAKHEAQAWETDSKVTHSVEKGVLLRAEAE